VKFTIDDFLSRLPLPANDRWSDGVWDSEPFKKGKVTLVFFAPRVKDHQSFHEEDEFYFIVRGSGEIVIEDVRSQVTSGDAIFVEARKPHRFENFTDDFATWAIFF
jgi:mannose-6-phosphate isomerase-like protein (cupin superfamily)